MKRTALVLGVMIVGISLMLWAGWHNLRDRRLAMQKAGANHVVLTPGQAMPMGQDNDGASEDEGARLKGKAAPGFTLTSLDGKRVSLADYKGRPVLLNFWATWCAPCKLEMPWFEDLRKQYGAQGFE
ncbi:MAG: redoxin domain-containing protein, partial [Edaphobacter sp.]